MNEPQLYTIGHSNHTIDQFIALLKQHEIEALSGTVQHILADGNLRPHKLSQEAKVRDGKVTYPASPRLFDGVP